MNKEQAEEYTQSLGQIVGGAWRQIALAKKMGIPKTLGLSTEDWVNEHLGGYVKMTVDDRRKAVEELTAEGESQRSTAEILGVDQATVSRDLRNDANASPDAPEPAEILKSDDDDDANATPIDTLTALVVTEKAREIADREEKKAAQKKRDAELAEEPVVWPDGIYPVIVVDPPWPMEKIERDVAPKQAGFDYPVMSLEEIQALDLPGIAADDCHLFVWTTQKFLLPTFDLVEGWGFHYVSTFVWHKNGGFQPFNLPQYNCEFVVYARKGAPKFRETKAFPICFTAPRGAHSEKPKEFYSMVARVTDGPRIDIFSRQERDGFDVYGNEAGKLSEKF